VLGTGDAPSKCRRQADKTASRSSSTLFTNTSSTRQPPTRALAYSLYNFYWATTTIKGRLLSSRSMLKPFSGHLAAILFYANYKAKTQNSAWETGSSHSACLNCVKISLVPHFYPKMHLTFTIYSKKCV